MVNNRREAPPHWFEELARSDEDIARGRIVPAKVVHDRIREAITEMEAESEQRV